MRITDTEYEIQRSIEYIEKLIEEIDKRRDVKTRALKTRDQMNEEINKLQERVLNELIDKKKIGLSTYRVNQDIKEDYKYKFINIARKLSSYKNETNIN